MAIETYQQSAFSKSHFLQRVLYSFYVIFLVPKNLSNVILASIPSVFVLVAFLHVIRNFSTRILRSMAFTLKIFVLLDLICFKKLVCFLELSCLFELSCLLNYHVYLNYPDYLKYFVYLNYLDFLNYPVN